MSNTAKGTFHIFDPKVGADIVVEEGQAIPAHLVDKVGEHLGGRFAGDEGAPVPAGGEPATGEAFDQAVQEAVDAQLAAADQAGYDRGRAEAVELEESAASAEGYGTFDPSGDGVNAKHVHDYLAGLDLYTYAGRTEYDRVVVAEKAGADRSSAIPAAPQS